MGIGGMSADAILDNGDVAVVGIGAQLELLWATPAAVRLFGAGHGQLPDLVDPDNAAAVASFLDRAAAASGSPVRTTCAIPVEGSNSRRVDLVARDLRAVEGVRCLVVVAHDVTGWAERESELTALAFRDTVTGLGNRASLTERLSQAVRNATLGGPGPAVLYFDVDRFKEVNDRFGHTVGDQVLAELGRRLSSSIVGLGTAYRLGGDELAVVLDRTSQEIAVQAAEYLLVILGEPFSPGAGGHVELSVSVGVAVADAELNHAAKLLSAADAAMYRAKSDGRHRVQCYRPEDRDWVLFRKQTVETLSERVAQLNREKEALLQAVSVDYRTGLANTAAFDADHARLHARFERTGEPYSVVLVDIDRFHEFNHRYHYLAGNHALERVAAMLAETIRTGDRAYRWGGEEFALLLPATRLHAAAAVAERVRAAVQRSGIDHCGNPSGVLTVTAGVAQARAGMSPEDVFEAVTALLIGGKDAGRNRVVTPLDQLGGLEGAPPLRSGAAG